MKRKRRDKRMEGLTRVDWRKRGKQRREGRGLRGRLDTRDGRKRKREAGVREGEGGSDG